MFEYLENSERYYVGVSMGDLWESTHGLSIVVVRFILPMRGDPEGIKVIFANLPPIGRPSQHNLSSYSRKRKLESR